MAAAIPQCYKDEGGNPPVCLCVHTHAHTAASAGVSVRIYCLKQGNLRLLYLLLVCRSACEFAHKATLSVSTLSVTTRPCARRCSSPILSFPCKIVGLRRRLAAAELPPVEAILLRDRSIAL